MADGWGDGEWHDMLWGGGAYPYAPVIFLASTGRLVSHAASGTLVRLTAHSSATALAVSGNSDVPKFATGALRSLAARGRLTSYTAAGTLEH